MVNQRRLAARLTFRDLGRDRGALGVQSPAPAIAGRIPPSLRVAPESRCRLVYLDGSFVMTKEHPGDFDACWDIQHVDEEALDPVFRDFSQGRAAQKRRFLGESKGIAAIQLRRSRKG